MPCLPFTENKTEMNHQLNWITQAALPHLKGAASITLTGPKPTQRHIYFKESSENYHLISAAQMAEELTCYLIRQGAT